MLVEFFLLSLPLWFQRYKNSTSIDVVFSNVLCCCFRRISSWSVGALFLWFVNDIWSIYVELLILQ
jgi:hypothetical protein